MYQSQTTINFQYYYCRKGYISTCKTACKPILAFARCHIQTMYLNLTKTGSGFGLGFFLILDTPREGSRACEMGSCCARALRGQGGPGQGCPRPPRSCLSAFVGVGDTLQGPLRSVWDISGDAAVVRNRRQRLENQAINKSLLRPQHLKLVMFFILLWREWQGARTKRSSASNVAFLSWNTTAVEKENNKIWKPFLEQMHIHIPLALCPQTTSLL